MNSPSVTTCSSISSIIDLIWNVHRIPLPLMLRVAANEKDWLARIKEEIRLAVAARES